jgi:hypothetical protein
MKIVVVYESMFGNTKTIGEAIAEGLSEIGQLAVGSVDELRPEDAADADLIVVGGPTHNRGLAKPDARAALSRRKPAAKGGTVLAGRESLRGWLDSLPAGRAVVTAFDTRLRKPAWIVGSAAKQVAQQVTGKGYRVAEAQSFFVRGAEGPLAEGERARALAWGKSLAALAKRPAAA